MTSAIIDAILGRLPNVEPTTYQSDKHTPNTDRSLVTTRHMIGIDGTLTGLEIVAVDGVPANDVYVRVVLEDDQQIERGTLFRGYLDGFSSPHGAGGKPVQPTWSFRIDSLSSMSTAPTLLLRGTFLSHKRQAGGWTGTDEGALDDGKVRLITGTNPPVGTVAVGTVSSEAVPSGAIWDFLGDYIQLATSATAGNRQLFLSLTDGSDTFVDQPVGTTVPASTANTRFSFYPNAPLATSITSNRITAPMPGNVRLNEGWTIELFMFATQMGDDLTAPLMRVLEHLVVQS